MFPILIAVALMGLSVTPALAQQTRSSASTDWNSNYSFPDSSSALVRLNRANLIEQQKNYKPPVTNVNNNSVNSTNIESMTSYNTNSTNVESMITVDGQNNSVNTQNSSAGNASNSDTSVYIVEPGGALTPIANGQ
jgi:negative regulator of sigma E activity